MKKKLGLVYQRIFSSFGPQRWWPADSPFEVIVGAILTQNTNWSNVEKAIKNLKKAKVLEAKKLYRLSHSKLAGLIRPLGYFNIKAGRLKEFLRFFLQNYQGDLKKMKEKKGGVLREELLAVKGIGPETADSILLYALNRPIFVVDAYTRRIFSRHGFIKDDASYSQIQNLFMKSVKNDVELFNEYHALLVRLGKDFCLKSKPKCSICPLINFNRRGNA